MRLPRTAIAVFVALVAATVAAFFVAQDLKTGPSVIQGVTVFPVVSPNGDGRKDGARISFKTREADDVIVEIVDRDGDIVKEIFDRRLPAYTPTQVRWDGRRQGGRIVADGLYRFRVTLRKQGRSIVVPRAFRVDTKPPHPRILGIGPTKDPRPQPELIPNAKGTPASVRFDAAGSKPRILLFKTGPGRPRPAMAPVDLPDGAQRWEWDGTIAGRKVSPGTYLVVVEVRDLAGNVGTSVPLGGDGLPASTYGAGLPGRGGITVRYLGVQPPIEPTRAGDRGEFFVDARQRRYRWNLRRVGGPPGPIRRGSGTRPRLAVKAPRGEGGVYLLEVRTRTRRVRVPWVVRPARPRLGTREQRKGVLVILALGTWQGLNPVDDDGDGLADTLDRGVPVRLRRVLVGDGSGLPRGFTRTEAPLLAHLDRTGRRYDVTTDIALASGRGPQLIDGYKGVILAGATRWLAPGAAKALRGFVRRGGTLASFGVQSLLREARLTKRARLVDPTVATATDLFGARLGKLSQASLTLTEFQDDIGLFEGTSGEFPGLTIAEPTVSIGRQAERAAAAVTASGQAVVVGARFGKGLVIRTGLPELPSRLSTDPQLAQIVRNIWTLLR